MRKKKKTLIWILIVILVLIAGFTVWKVYTQWGKMYEAMPPTDQGTPEPPIQNLEGVYSFLFLGVDSGDIRVGRSDAIIQGYINTKLNKIWLLSIPRDTYVHIYGRKGYDKINHAYAYGGINSLTYTVEQFLQVPVNYYVASNFNGVKKFVDELGGIEIEVEKNMEFQDRIVHEKFHLDKGRQTLSGEQVLNYVRYRGDAEGDVGRVRRQQKVMKEVLNQTMSYRNMLRINNLLPVLGDNVKTNIPFRLLTFLVAQMVSLSDKDVTTVVLDAVPVIIGGISYMKITEQERKRVSNILQHIAIGGNYP